ncbi:MAG: SIMPL domain-containing protein [Xenococcaceae cyanobacterium MO_188.B29]|nr:SIMPL domain-containing protein [Xenococcaceae cyanobacterium MO_188.B29]
MRRYLKSRKTKTFIAICQGFCLSLAIGSFFSYALISPAMAQEEVLRTLSVTGQGIERIPATLAQVRLGVEIQGKTAAEVQQEVAKRTSAVVEFLRSRNVERLQTQGISLQPNYNYNDNQRRLVGYIGRNTVSFRLSTEEVGKLLDEAVQAGATRIDNISFTATETEIASAQKEALRKATVEAQQQADAVLQALNLSTKEIIGIQINGANMPQPKMIQRERLALAADADAATTPVIGGEQVVRGSVTLQIRY